MKNGLRLPFIAEAPILPARILKFGTAAGTVIQATTNTDVQIGVSPLKITYVAGELVDVILSESPLLQLGGTVAQGVRLTTDSVGRGILATGSVRTIGLSLQAGVIGDIIPILISQSPLLTP